MKEITPEKLEKYFSVTKAALDKVKVVDEKGKDFLDMAQRYYSDAQWFHSKEDFVNAFAALNYAHGWLDAGARARFFDVDGDNVLFTVDREFCSQ
ncbi:MAG: DUF357 domain-containing protein [Candidatus Nanoarchaeia archaeon]